MSVEAEWGYVLRVPEEVDVFVPVDGATCSEHVKAEIRRQIKASAPEEGSAFLSPDNTLFIAHLKKVEPKVSKRIVKVEM